MLNYFICEKADVIFEQPLSYLYVNGPLNGIPFYKVSFFCLNVHNLAVKPRVTALITIYHAI